MTLILEIEHLLGVAFAARDQSSEAPDWPPQPDRVFSALVAAWGARGEQDGERHALEWLEAQQAPLVLASAAEPRTAHTAYVPPNDYRIPSGPLNAVKWYRDFLSKGVSPPEKGGHRKAWLEAWNVMPEQRKRSGLKDRKFPAARPHDPIVRLVWPEAMPDRDTLAALNALAADTAYVGHSASLTRCRFRDDDAPPAPAAAAGRRVYTGRLAELERDFQAGPPRRPSPGAPVRAAPDRSKEVLSGVFATEWLVLEHVGGEMPDIRASALVAKELRNAVMSGYREIGLGEAIPAAVSGHSPDGQPSSEPHLAIAPLAFVGAPYASGTVFGFALIPPRGSELFNSSYFRQAMRAISLSDGETGRQVIKVYSTALALTLAFGDSSQRRSLDPAPYVGEARVWASCTPIVLDLHLKAPGNEARQLEIEGLLRQACVNAGLPEPVAVSAGKHSAIEGALPAYPSGGAPRWTRWKVPERLSSRQLIHAVVAFSVPVRGPVILGAGRFVGLGLCRPFDTERRR
jgi:CRISPR-associated protein Csb2